MNEDDGDGDEYQYDNVDKGILKYKSLIYKIITVLCMTTHARILFFIEDENIKKSTISTVFIHVSS